MRTECAPANLAHVPLVRALPLTIALAVACAPACFRVRHPPFPDVPERAVPEPPPKLERRRTYYDKEARELETETRVLVWAGGRTQLHGEALEWYRSGAMKAHRAYDHGEPTGTWTTWYESGARRSECIMGADAPLAPMNWWYADGHLECQGPARNGSRQGTWTLWHPDGKKAAEGEYRDDLREGEWTFWDADGRVTERCVYRANVKVERLSPR